MGPTGSGGEYVLTDADLRLHHEFVGAFETLRKQHGHREMDEAALADVAESTGLLVETLRIARHLRNAIAHDDPVNSDAVTKYHQKLAQVLGTTPGPSGPTQPPTGRPPPPIVRAYRVHGWRDPRLEQEMIANGFVSVGGDEIGDLSGVTDLDQIRATLTETMPDRTASAIGIFVGYWRRFRFEASPGDLVVLPTRDRCVAIGTFVGPYHYVSHPDARARHRRAVSWDAEEVDRDAFGPDLEVVLKGRPTIQDFKMPDAVARLRALADNGIDPGPGVADLGGRPWGAS